MLVAVERQPTRSPGGSDGGSGREAQCQQLFSAVFLLLYADAPASVFLPPLLLFGSSPLDLGCFLLSAVRPPQCTMVSLNGGAACGRKMMS